MALPKRKVSKQKTRSRRSHHALGKPNLVACKNCGTFIAPHRACPTCGFYKDRVVKAPRKIVERA